MRTPKLDTHKITSPSLSNLFFSFFVVVQSGGTILVCWVYVQASVFLLLRVSSTIMFLNRQHLGKPLPCEPFFKVIFSLIEQLPKFPLNQVTFMKMTLASKSKDKELFVKLDPKETTVSFSPLPLELCLVHVLCELDCESN